MKRLNLILATLIAFLCFFSINAQTSYEEWVAGQFIDNELAPEPTPPL